MSTIEILDEFPHGIVVLEGDEVLHICLYPEEPTLADCQGLVEELQTDPEFGLMEMDFNKMSFCKAEGELLIAAMKAFSDESE